MQISSVHVAGTLFTSGLVAGGYFGYRALVPPSLEEHLRALNVDLLTNNWGAKEEKYKKSEGEELIPSIQKTEGQTPITNFANNLQSWCEKKKIKYFLGENDLTYKRFSLWCTTTKTIKDVLSGRNLKNLDAQKQQSKVAAYNALQETDKFISTKPPKKDKTIQFENLNKWCEEEKAKEYKYEGDENLKRIIKWCYV